MKNPGALKGAGTQLILQLPKSITTTITFKHLLKISLQTTMIAKSNYSEDEQPLWYKLFPEQPLKYHNCKSQRMNNQYYPLLDNLQDITFEMFSEFL